GRAARAGRRERAPAVARPGPARLGVSVGLCLLAVSVARVGAGWCMAGVGLWLMPGRLARARRSGAPVGVGYPVEFLYCYMRRVASRLKWNARTTAPMSVTKSPEARDCQSKP